VRKCRIRRKKSENATKVGVLRDSMIFWREKEKKTVLAGLRLKKQQWRHNCTGTVLFWLFREINGDKVATG
jgi:hypothetical protein